MRTIDIAKAQSPLVLAIDVGSSSVRALLYDRHGLQVDQSEEQLPYRQHVTKDGGSESDPGLLLNLLVRCVDRVVSFANDRHAPIAAVGVTSFWHGLMGLEADGSPGTPVYMWSDKRSGPDATTLSEEVDPGASHQRTGCRIHSSYWPAKLRWLQRVRPDQSDRIATWVSFTDYLALELFGELATSVSMASGTGILNGATLQWDVEMLEALGMQADTLPAIVDRSEPGGQLLELYAKRWPSLVSALWFPAIGDGAAANVGAGCVGDTRIAMTIGTSAAMRLILHEARDRASGRVLPHRLWSYRLDRYHEVLGGALSNGGNVTGWVASHWADGDFETLAHAAEKIAPDGHGLTMLPFLAGERSPSWNDNATGTISGLRLSTSGGDLFRATLEAAAYRMAAIYDDVRLLAAQEHEIHANGAAALSSPLWLQIMADTLGHSLDAVDAEAEASARGAALCALESIGALRSLGDIGNTVSQRFEPDQDAHRVYAAARVRQEALEYAINGFTQLERRNHPES